MRYVVDLRHPLQTPCGRYGRVEWARKDIYIQSSRPWECGNPEGISKKCGKGGKPASWLSTLSILCHFHGLLFGRQMLDKPICRNPVQCDRTRHETLIGTHRLSLSASSKPYSCSFDNIPLTLLYRQLLYASGAILPVAAHSVSPSPMRSAPRIPLLPRACLPER